MKKGPRLHPTVTALFTKEGQREEEEARGRSEEREELRRRGSGEEGGSDVRGVERVEVEGREAAEERVGEKEKGGSGGGVKRGSSSVVFQVALHGLLVC